MTKETAISTIDKWQPTLLITGVVQTGENDFKFDSTAVVSSKDYDEAIKRYVHFRVYRLEPIEKFIQK
jgi:hypothetical protein